MHLRLLPSQALLQAVISQFGIWLPLHPDAGECSCRTPSKDIPVPPLLARISPLQSFNLATPYMLCVSECSSAMFCKTSVPLCLTGSTAHLPIRSARSDVGQIQLL